MSADDDTRIGDEHLLAARAEARRALLWLVMLTVFAISLFYLVVEPSSRAPIAQAALDPEDGA